MASDPHFGEEDPLYFPQPFSLTLPHLALIPLPSASDNDKHGIAWYRLTHFDFVLVSPEDQSGSCGSLGVITSNVRARMQSAIDDATSRISTISSLSSVPDGPSTSTVEQDKFVRDYTCSLQWLMAQLNCACTRNRAVMTFSLVQRVYLELVARTDWKLNYEVRYRNFSICRSESVAKVVGALVGNVETAEHLWRIRIPLWLVRDIETKDPNLRVDKWVNPGDPAENLAARTGGFRLSFEEAEPPNPNVWTGMLNITRFEQYSAMSRLLRRSATAHLYEEEPKPTALPSQSSPAAPASKFVEVEANIMPFAIKAWREAAETVGQHFNPNAHKNPLGYFLPDPQMIAGLGHKDGISTSLAQAAACTTISTQDTVSQAIGTQSLENDVGHRENAVQGPEVAEAKGRS
ncbi:hypothetical protein K435DRAFT_824370 [Dendrothele bispora CBS 962.96]|uniref:Uncharacterized protein n=1 Tax=Dendrothele bispora (strain CBS 962.96) TaxID=1314807 RepID=A0A4S8KNQ4_DENBC|nr:hypothetical protein K435DRAFT_824370 [Dendrothele bispora CBS 962.96]